MHIKSERLVVAASLAFIATGAWATDYFDGTKPLLCSTYQLFECDPPNACQAVSPAEINGVSHFDIDFDKKTAGLQDSDLVIVAGRPAMGKTTLANLLPRFVEVASGQVLLDGVSVNSFTHQCLHSNVSYWKQRVYFLSLCWKSPAQQ